MQSLFVIGGAKLVLNEKTLIEKIKKGDIDAFSDLVTRYEKKALNFAYRMLKNSEEAEDATQEAFFKVFDKIHTFHGKSSFSTWFYTILNNICLDILRKRTRRAEVVSISQTSNDDNEYELQIEDTSDGPFEKLQKKDAKILLEQALSKLSNEHRAVIVMRDINDLEYEEIAKILNVSLGTVKSRISRARLALRKILEENKELFV